MCQRPSSAGGREKVWLRTVLDRALSSMRTSTSGRLPTTSRDSSSAEFSLSPGPALYSSPPLLEVCLKAHEVHQSSIGLNQSFEVVD